MSADGRGGYPIGSQARREAGNLEQRLENLLLWGSVEEIDEEAVMVRIRYGQKPEKKDDPDYSVLSPWIKVGQGRYGDTRSQAMPEKDEWVLVLNSSGMLENGIVLCSIPYRNEDKDKGFVHPAKSKEDERTIYGPAKVLADLVKHSFKTFNRKAAVFWRYLKGGGIYRIEIGKNTKTNTYFEIREGRIEARVGSNKIVIDNGGIAAFYNGNAASVELDNRGVTIGIRDDHVFAKVPNDKYGGTEGESPGQGTGSVLNTKKTTVRIQNGQIVATMDDKAQVVVNPNAIIATLKDSVQQVLTRGMIESSVFGGPCMQMVGSLVNIELGQCRLTLEGDTAELHVGTSRVMLTSQMIEALMQGSSTTWKQDGMVFKAPDFKFNKGMADGSPFVAVANATPDVDAVAHPDTAPPDDLPRPNIELGVKPFMPEM